MHGSPNLYRSGSRLAGAFWSDCAGGLTETLGEDMGPCISFLSILAANLGDAEKVAQAPPQWDALIRHPVSVYRLARDLGIPYETVRRYAARLARKSLVVRQGDGLIVPHAVMDGPELVALLNCGADMSARLHAQVQGLGMPLGTQGEVVSPEHHRRIALLSIFYFLRGVDIATQTLDVGPVPSMVHFSIHRANLAHLNVPPPAEYLDEADVHLDDVRRPVSVFAIARQLNLPYETARRHVNALAKRGLVHRAQDEGFIVPGALLKTPAFIKCVQTTMTTTLNFLETAFSPSMH